MDSSKRKIGYLKGHNVVCDVSLKDVPFEVRRQEAEKPLFLMRYE
ncbi:MAG: hypothetical protein WC046_07725 [Candidatus Bathyarchaeia archaeon]|jgi:hypothetical protein